MYRYSIVVGVILLSAAAAAAAAVDYCPTSTIGATVVAPAATGEHTATGCTATGTLRLSGENAPALPNPGIVVLRFTTGTVAADQLVHVLGLPNPVAAATAVPIHIAVTSSTFLLNAVLRIEGAYPPNSTVNITGNTVTINARNAVALSDVYSSFCSFMLIGSATAIHLHQGASILVTENAFTMLTPASKYGIVILVHAMTMQQGTTVAISRNRFVIDGLDGANNEWGVFFIDSIAHIVNATTTSIVTVIGGGASLFIEDNHFNITQRTNASHANALIANSPALFEATAAKGLFSLRRNVADLWSVSGSQYLSLRAIDIGRDGSAFIVADNVIRHSGTFYRHSGAVVIRNSAAYIIRNNTVIGPVPMVGGSSAFLLNNVTLAAFAAEWRVEKNTFVTTAGTITAPSTIRVTALSMSLGSIIRLLGNTVSAAVPPPTGPPIPPLVVADTFSVPAGSGSAKIQACDNRLYNTTYRSLAPAILNDSYTALVLPVVCTASPSQSPSQSLPRGTVTAPGTHATDSIGGTTASADRTNSVSSSLTGQGDAASASASRDGISHTEALSLTLGPVVSGTISTTTVISDTTTPAVTASPPPQPTVTHTPSTPPATTAVPPPTTITTITAPAASSSNAPSTTTMTPAGSFSSTTTLTTTTAVTADPTSSTMTETTTSAIIGSHTSSPTPASTAAPVPCVATEPIVLSAHRYAQQLLDNVEAVVRFAVPVPIVVSSSASDPPLLTTWSPDSSSAPPLEGVACTVDRSLQTVECRLMPSQAAAIARAVEGSGGLTLRYIADMSPLAGPGCPNRTVVLRLLVTGATAGELSTAVVMITASSAAASLLTVAFDPAAWEGAAAVFLLIGPCTIRFANAAAVTQYLVAPAIALGGAAVALIHAGSIGALVAVHALLALWGGAPRAWFPSVSLAAAAVLYPGLVLGTAITLRHIAIGNHGGTEIAAVAFGGPVLVAMPCVVFAVLRTLLGADREVPAPTRAGTHRSSSMMGMLHTRWTSPVVARSAGLLRGLYHHAAAPVQHVLQPLLLLAVAAVALVPPASGSCTARYAIVAALVGIHACVSVVVLRPYRARVLTILSAAAHLSLAAIAATLAADTAAVFLEVSLVVLAVMTWGRLVVGAVLLIADIRATIAMKDVAQSAGGDGCDSFLINSRGEGSPHRIGLAEELQVVPRENPTPHR